MKQTKSGFPAPLRSLCGVAVLFLAACGSPDASSGRNEKGRTEGASLRMITSFRINNLGPTDPRAFFLPEFGVAELPLRLEADGQLRPWLLESFERIDPRNWRLRLRPNVTFQNGRPLTAKAMAAAMNRQLEQCASAKATLPGAKVSTSGERELTLTTAEPDATTPNALADELVFPIYDVDAVEAAGKDASRLVGSGCFTGPYKVVRLDEREMRLARHDQYWQGLPPLTSVSLRFVADGQARILAAQNDEVDIALYPPSEARRILADRSDAFLKTSSQSHGGPRIFLNLRKTPFDELAVRRAFSLGINYQSLATDIMEGLGDVATGFYPLVWPWAAQNQKTNLNEARRLLEEAGWRVGGDGVRIKTGQPLEVTLLVYPQQPDFATLATAIQAQLREAGFRIQIRQVEDINAAMRDSNIWHAAFHSPGLVTTGGAPEPFLREPLTSKGERNCGGVNDAELDRLVEELSRTVETKRRAALLARIQEIVIVERVYEVRPVFLRSRVVVGRRWRGYQPSPQLHHITYETRPDQ